MDPPKKEENVDSRADKKAATAVDRLEKARIADKENLKAESNSVTGPINQGVGVKTDEDEDVRVKVLGTLIKTEPNSQYKDNKQNKLGDSLSQSYSLDVFTPKDSSQVEPSATRGCSANQSLIGGNVVVKKEFLDKHQCTHE